MPPPFLPRIRLILARSHTLAPTKTYTIYVERNVVDAFPSRHNQSQYSKLERITIERARKAAMLVFAAIARHR